MLCNAVYIFKNASSFQPKFENPAEAALQSRSYEKVFWKYTANLQENIYAEVWYQ